MATTTPTRRAKLVAGTGLITMLLGALLAFAPTAGAIHEDNPVRDGKLTICHSTSASSNPYVLQRPSIRAQDGQIVFNGNNDHTGHGADDAIFPEPDWGDIIPAFTFDGVTFPGKNWSTEGQAFFHNSCALPGAPTLTVEKAVKGTAPTDAVFEIDVALAGVEDLIADNAAIAPGTPGTDFSTKGAGTYDIDEVTTGSASSTGWECFVGDETTASRTGSDASIEDVVVGDDDVRCVFTNTYAGSTAPTLTVEKAVVGVAPTNAVFEIDVAREGAQSLVADNAAIAPGNPGTDFTTTGAGTYDIDEVTTGSASSTAWACFVGDETAASRTGSDASIEDVVVGDDDVRCVFTNTYASGFIPPEQTPEPEEATLQIVKVATGDVPAAWSADFAGDLGNFTLRTSQPSRTVTALAPGPYTVVEIVDGPSELVRIECDEGADVTVNDALASVTVTLEDEDFVSCTFTNNFPEVEPSEVTRPSTVPAPPTTQEPAEVLPDVVTRPATLPRTGNETRNLAGIGVALLALGAVLVGASRRELLRS